MGIPSGYTSAQVVQAVPTGINSALVLISSTTIGNAVSSVTVSNAFSSTYDAYQIIVSGGVASTDAGLTMHFGSTTTGYYFFQNYSFYNSSTLTIDNRNNQSNFIAAAATTGGLYGNIFVNSPNLAKPTRFDLVRAVPLTNSLGGIVLGFENSNTQHTAFTLTTTTGTVTGGTIRVYGYANS